MQLYMPNESTVIGAYQVCRVNHCHVDGQISQAQVSGVQGVYMKKRHSVKKQMLAYS